MAATTDQPISVGNLAAALNGAGIGREVLMANQFNADFSVRNTFNFYGSPDEYDAFEVEVVNNLEGWKDTVPATGGTGTHGFEYTVTTASRTGNFLFSVDGNGASTYIVMRIVGIRSGGGRLLADALLAAIGGER